MNDGVIFTEPENRQLSFANKAPFLLINSKSVEWLRNKIPGNDLEENLTSTVERFRPNFIVDLLEPFEENNAEEYLIDNIRFKVSLT